MTARIKCLVVDDELPAREILKKHISGVESLELVSACSNAIEANSFLQTHVVDMMFLDIQMPRLLGTKFIRTLKNPPKVIFTTAFRKFAVEGFELDAVDYLLKPISFERFLKAVNKVLKTSLPPQEVPEDEQAKNNPSRPFLYFRSDRQMVKVLFRDILFIEGMKDYIKIITTTKTIITKHLLSSMEEMLPQEEFIRIHRSFIIAVQKVDSFGAEAVEIAGKKLPIGRLYKHVVMKALTDHRQ
jgi:DNA-binding LytR/AlgR family response regulator